MRDVMAAALVGAAHPHRGWQAPSADCDAAHAGAERRTDYNALYDLFSP